MANPQKNQKWTVDQSFHKDNITNDTGETSADQSAAGTGSTANASNNTSQNKTQTQQIGLTKGQYAEIKALKADKEYGVTDAVTASNNQGFSVSGTDNLISERGTHYSKADVDRQIKESGKSFQEAITDLAKLPPYTNGDKDKNKEAAINDAVGTEEKAAAWAKQEGYTVPNETNTNVQSDDNAKSEEDLKKKAEEQKTPTAAENAFTRTQLNQGIGSNKEVIFPESDYTTILCEYANQQTRKDTITPMIPVSVIVSIALARTGTRNLDIGKYNFWKLPYDKTISPLKSDTDDMCAFSTLEDGINGILKFCRKDNIKEAVAHLKEKMADSTEEDKKATIKDIITRIDAISSDDTNTRALNFIDKYKLFEWDSDKTVEEGGHADQLPGTDRSKANSNTMSNIISAVDRIATLAQKHGIGFLIKPMGTEHSLIQKLLPGMTLCEPVYPDLITVGDTIPDWGAKCLTVILIMGCVTLYKTQINQH